MANIQVLDDIEITTIEEQDDDLNPLMASINLYGSVGTN